MRVLLICFCIGWVCGAAERVATLPSTNGHPALLRAQQALREAIKDRRLTRSAYYSISRGNPEVGGKPLSRLDWAIITEDRMAHADMREAEEEVTRLQAVVVAMLAGIQSASKTNKVVVAISPAEAATVKFLQEQSDTGSLRAKFDLGVRYIDGRGVGKDEAKGWGHIQAAADLGYEPAQARWAAHLKDLAVDATSVTSP